LCELARCLHVGCHLDHRSLGIDDTEVDDRADLDGDIVPGDHILARNLVDDDTEIDADHLLDERYEQHEARSLGAGIAAEREDDAALVLAQDPDRRTEDKQDEDDDDGNGNGDSGDEHASSFLSRGRIEPSHRLDGENEVLAADDLDARPRLQGTGSASAPNLAFDADSPFLSAPVHGLPLGAEHGLAAGNDAVPPGAQEHGK
jgi:hypothetical protein